MDNKNGEGWYSDDGSERCFIERVNVFGESSERRLMNCEG